MKWWTDWIIPLLFASGILLIVNGGIALTILLWFFHLRSGWIVMKKNPNDENVTDFVKHLIIGIVVVIASIAFLIYAHSN
jgi:hypothetical protein